MKGMFIPEITVEMFRNACLESIETLMAEGEVYDIEYDPKSEEQDVPDTNVGKWIPCSEELPKNGTSVLFCDDEGDIYNGYCLVKDGGRYPKWMEYHNADRIKNVVAWMHWPEPYKGDEE